FASRDNALAGGLATEVPCQEPHRARLRLASEPPGVVEDGVTVFLDLEGPLTPRGAPLCVGLALNFRGGLVDARIQFLFCRVQRLVGQRGEQAPQQGRQQTPSSRRRHCGLLLILVGRYRGRLAESNAISPTPTINPRTSPATMAHRAEHQIPADHPAD